MTEEVLIRIVICLLGDSRGPVEQKMNRLLELLHAVPVLIAIYMTTKWMRR